MEYTPAASFIVTERRSGRGPIALDALALLGQSANRGKADVLRQCGEPVFGRLFFALLPLYQQPLRRQLLVDQFVVPDADTHTREREMPLGRAFPPLTLPTASENGGNLAETNSGSLQRPVLFIGVSIRLGRCQAPTSSGRHDADHVWHAQFRHACTQPRVPAVGRIDQARSPRCRALSQAQRTSPA